MSTVQVSLDTNASPPVTCNPQKTPVNRGNEEINWVQAQNQNFTFYSLSFQNNPPCFGSPEVSDDEITVTDDNEDTADYPYTIVVTLNGVQYSSAGGGLGGNPGGPTIQNK